MFGMPAIDGYPKGTIEFLGYPSNSRMALERSIAGAYKDIRAQNPQNCEIIIADFERIMTERRKDFLEKDIVIKYKGIFINCKDIAIKRPANYDRECLTQALEVLNAYMKKDNSSTIPAICAALSDKHKKQMSALLVNISTPGIKQYVIHPDTNHIYNPNQTAQNTRRHLTITTNNKVSPRLDNNNNNLRTTTPNRNESDSTHAKKYKYSPPEHNNNNILPDNNSNGQNPQEHLYAFPNSSSPSGFAVQEQERNRSRSSSPIVGKNLQEHLPILPNSPSPSSFAAQEEKRNSYRALTPSAFDTSQFLNL